MEILKISNLTVDKLTSIIIVSVIKGHLPHNEMHLLADGQDALSVLCGYFQVMNWESLSTDMNDYMSGLVFSAVYYCFAYTKHLFHTYSFSLVNVPPIEFLVFP